MYPQPHPITELIKVFYILAKEGVDPAHVVLDPWREVAT